jgi:hypothetical protein
MALAGATKGPGRRQPLWLTCWHAILPAISKPSGQADRLLSESKSKRQRG